MTDLLHPVVPFVLGALAIPLLGIAGRRAVSLLAPAAALCIVLSLAGGSTSSMPVLGMELHWLRFDAMARLMAIAFTSYALIAGLFAWRETAALPKAASLALAGSGVGVVCAGDLLAMLLFWEAMAISSLFLIWNGASRDSLAAGYRYILMHIIGGLCVLGSIILQLSRGGDLSLTAMTLGDSVSWLLLLGVATNAGIPLLHAWLPDAYPRATIFGTVFLAAFTTKSAVYVLARMFPGTEVLVWAGAIMTLYGVVFAVLENDIRRLLSYHIISQVGYMVCGVGIGTTLALNGSLAHAFSHIFYKGLLLMSAGAVIYATGRGKLSDLGQLARPLRWTLIFMTIGAFSISGVPLFNGFISKSMVVSAAAQAHLPTIELMLLVASMGTFLSIGLKLIWFTFFGPAPHTPHRQPLQLPISMVLAMSIAAGVCIVTGLAPAILYSSLPFPVEYHPYTLDHILTALQLLLGTALGFWLLRNVFGGKATVTLDVDYLYRRPLQGIVQIGGLLFASLFTAVEHAITHTAQRCLALGCSYQLAVRRTSIAHRLALIFLFLAAVWFASYMLL